MTTPVSTKLSPASAMITPPRGHTLSQPGGLEVLQARLEELSQEWHTPEPEIDPDLYPPAWGMQCESVWYFFDGARLDAARDTIVSELYWRLEFATLFNYWVEQNPAANQMLELADLWCSCAAGGWRAIAVVLRNKILGAGLSYNELKEIRLSCKHEEYFEIEFKHLEPIAERIERNHWLTLYERAEKNTIYALECEMGLVPQAPPIPPAQQAQSAQPAQSTPLSPSSPPSPPSPVAPPAPVPQPEQPAPAQRKKRQPRQQKQDIPRPNVTTRAQSRKQEERAGKEPNFLRERKDNDRNSDTAHNKTTRRKNTGNNMGAVEKKTDARKGRRTGTSRKRGNK
ncbi:hypothetical protein F5Y01DRAFT_320037 [Xylaria sp. FL0043]|nr:hypothetical protein F5Y01DRAFT_320037 [Xylaria sp. FL0043]